MEVGFVDQFVDFDTKLVEELVVVVKKVPNPVDVGMEIFFHDQLDGFDMEITEHLVMDNQADVGDDLYVGEHLVVRNEIVDGKSLTYVMEELHIVVSVDLVMDLHVCIMDVEFDAFVTEMDCGDKLHADW